MRKTKNNKKHKTLSKIRHKLYSKRKGRGVGASKLSARLARIPHIPSIRSVKTQTRLVKTQKQLDEEYEMTFVRMKDVLNRTNDALAEAETLRYHRDLLMEQSNTALVTAQSAIAEAERAHEYMNLAFPRFSRMDPATPLVPVVARAMARAEVARAAEARAVAEKAVVEWKTAMATTIESALTAAESAIATAEVAVEAKEATEAWATAAARVEAERVVAARAVAEKEAARVAARASWSKAEAAKAKVAVTVAVARQAAEDAVSVWKKLTSEEVTNTPI